MDENHRSFPPCIILAAGSSQRMGKPKQFLLVGGEALLSRVIRTALEACPRIIVVEGAYAVEELLPQDASAERVLLVRNPDYHLGRLTSLKRGLVAAEEEEVFVMLGDLALLRPATYGLIAAAGAGHPAAYPVCSGRRGHPVLLGREARALILAAEPGRKAMDVIAPLDPLRVETDDPGIYLDADTPEQYRELLLRHGIRTDE